jgi:Ca2+-binding RTX toxin-like protein
MAIIYGKVQHGYYDKPYGDTIDGADGVTNGSDVIIGTHFGDTIHGLGGNDVLKGGGGADMLYGDAGTDTADYSDSGSGVQVSLQLGAGSGGTAEGDHLFDIENLSGSNYDDTLVGDGNDNALYGQGGNDVLKGGGGADTLDGGAGDDTLNSDGIGDKLDGGDGIDTANFSESQTGVYVDLAMGRYNLGLAYQPVPQGTPDNIVDVENVYGSNQTDHLHGDGNDNFLAGNGGVDFLYGRGGNDTLDGGAGKDWLDGGTGNDHLTGGADADTFIFHASANNVIDIGHDDVMDFTAGQDHILIDHTILADYAAVQSHMQQVGNDVVITVDADNSVTLHNVSVGNLSMNDFLFQ